MTLLDTIDGTFMNFAYGWVFSKTVRKMYYSLTIVGIFVVTWAVALLIWRFGRIEERWGGPADN